MEEVDLEVRLRKTERRVPVTLDVKEVMAVLDKIDARFGLMAKIQYVGGSADDPDFVRALRREDDGNLHACSEGCGSDGSEESAESVVRGGRSAE